MNGGNNGTGFGTRNELVAIDKRTWQIAGRVETPCTSPDGIIVGAGKVYVVSDDNNWVDGVLHGGDIRNL